MKQLMTLTSALALSTAVFSGTVFAQGFADPNDPQAQNYTQTGFVDESLVLKSVQELANAQDNAPVRIDGQIVKQLDKKHFTFKDASGAETQIEVSKKAWNGQTISPTDNVQIIGKVDKEWNKTEVEVKHILKK